MGADSAQYFGQSGLLLWGTWQGGPDPAKPLSMCSARSMWAVPLTSTGFKHIFSCIQAMGFLEPCGIKHLPGINAQRDSKTRGLQSYQQFALFLTVLYLHRRALWSWQCWRLPVSNLSPVLSSLSLSSHLPFKRWIQYCLQFFAIGF